MSPDDSRIRPVDVERDLIQIADLIDVCFSATMDEDGREYVQHLRRAAEDPTLRRKVAGPNEQISLPIAGYVWEERGQIIGNLSLIPFYRQRRWRTMIANVAVHPSQRRRGVARALTQKALQHIRQHHVPEAWLQVREDNPPAQALYLSLGFKKRCCRATWECDPNNPTPSPSLALVKVSKRRLHNWQTQHAWLNRLYPAEVAWNLGNSAARLKPDLIQSLARWLEGDIQQHWRADKWADLLGFVTWEAHPHTQGAIWLAPNPLLEEESLLALLAIVRQYIATRRTISLNLPAHLPPAPFAQAGFTLLNTLIWMSADTA